MTGVLAQVERLGDPHSVLRLLRGEGVLVRIGRSHQELACGDQDQFQFHALAQVHREFLRRARCLAARLLGFFGSCHGKTAECCQEYQRNCQ